MKGKTAFTELKEQEKEIRRNIILEAAQRVFATKPYGKVSMREIAKEANISAPSIYTYFPDQETLFVEAALKGTQAMINAFAKTMNDKHDLDLERVAETFIDYLIEHDVYFRMMADFVLHAQLSPESFERLRALQRAILKIFDAAFFNMNMKSNVRLLSHLFFAALNGILISFRRDPYRNEEEELKHMKRLSRILCDLFKSYAAQVPIQES